MLKRLWNLLPAAGIPAEIDPDGGSRALVRAGIALFLGVFVLGGGWFLLAPLSGAIVAQGTLKVEDSRKTVQHLEGGIVREILVKEGDAVRAGQPLMRLADAQVSAAFEVLQDQYNGEMAKEARLEAEAGFLDRLHFQDELARRQDSPKIATLLQQEESLFKAKRTSLEGQIKLIRVQIEQTKSEAVGLTQQIKHAEEGIGYLRQQLDANAALFDKGFVQKTRLLDFQRALAEKEEKQGEYVANLAMARQKTAELELRIISLRNAYQQDSVNELKETKKRLFDLQDRLRPTADMVKRQTVVAPVAGQVVGLRIHTPGGTVAPREPLMDIVPAEGRLIVEARVQPPDIAHIQLGQPVEMRITAFKRRSTPMLKGKVIYVSTDSFAENSLVGGRNYYLAHVEIEADSVKKLEGKILTAGMPADVYFDTGERTAFEYLLDPVILGFAKGLREP